MVDIETNPLYYATVGGLILGLSISIHYYFKGNVTGMSGAIFDIISYNKGKIYVYLAEFSSKLALIGGLFFAGGLFFDIFQYNTYNKFTPFGPQQNLDEKTSYLGFALAGLFVGFGTKLGNGCTSGHGLCGLSRLSLRSFVAVIVFLTCAIAIGTIRYYFGLGPFTSEDLSPSIEYVHLASANIALVFGLIFIIIGACF